MNFELSIKNIKFTTKKEAIAYFKGILNKYQCGQELNESDFNDVIELLRYHENHTEKFGPGIKKIRIEKIKYGKRCFHLIRTDSSVDHFSYLKCINGGPSLQTKFSRACRQAIQEDINNIKKKYFKEKAKSGKAPCQETKVFYSWEELCVDHRQPNTFSVIVDRFIEVFQIDIKNIEYHESIENIFEFSDNDIKERFRQYHREKANLRIVCKSLNSSRAHLARNKRQKLDLSVQ